MKALITFVFVLFFLLQFGCHHEVNTANNNIILPVIGTQSDTVCFNSEVLPLYVSYCASAGCHDVVSHKEGVILTDYANIMRGIRAKDATRSENYTVIGKDMPPRGSPQMTAANMSTILKWINQGALNTICTNTCDTSAFKYTTTISGIIATNCGGCHGTKPGSANIYLGDYASAKLYISTSKTTFLNSINHLPSLAASKRMPPSNKMIDCKIDQIQKWINNGYSQ